MCIIGLGSRVELRRAMACALIAWRLACACMQKMLAHRVAQAYGLQTSTVDYEDGFGRVIGSRTKDTRLRKVRGPGRAFGIGC